VTSKSESVGFSWDPMDIRVIFRSCPRVPDARSASADDRLRVTCGDGTFGCLREVSERADIKVTSVQNHVDRGMRKLRRHRRWGAMPERLLNTSSS
jgi:hypothetical protein